MLRVLAAFALVPVAVLIAACAETGKVDESAPVEAQAVEATDAPTLDPAPSSTPLPQSLSAESLLEAALVALPGAGPFHFDTNIELSVQAAGLGLEVPMTVTGDYESADSFRADMSLSMVLITVDIEIISKDGTAYLKDPATEEWTVLMSGTPAFADPTQFLRFEAAKLEGLVLEGVEAIDGVDSYRLTATAPVGEYGLSSGEVGLSFWVGVDDGLPRRVAVDGSIVLGEEEAGPLATLGSGDFSASIVLTLSEFGQAKTIEAPDTGQ